MERHDPRASGRRRLPAALIVVAAALAGCSGGSGSSFDFDLATWVSIADIDGDGRLDLLLLQIEFDRPPPHGGKVRTLLQDAANPGTFLNGPDLRVGFDPWAMEVADVNGDLVPDVVTANRNSADLSVVLQDAGQPGVFFSEIIVPLPGFPDGVDVGDVDGDGRADLVAASATMNAVFVLTQSPQGTFVSLSVVPIASPFGVVLEDLDGDGRPDLVSPTPGGVAIVLQAATTPFSFLPPVIRPAGSQPSHAAVDDLDGDGRPDIAVANFGPPAGGTGSVSVFLQDPAAPGTFLPATNFPTGPLSTFVATGDLDGDARPDLAVANGPFAGADGTVSVLFQDPLQPGAFLPATNLASTFQPLSVAIGDLDGDGAADIAVADDGARVFFQDPVTGAFLPQVYVGP